jgi:transcriptional regulator with XRE-family HTH domain
MTYLHNGNNYGMEGAAMTLHEISKPEKKRKLSTNNEYTKYKVGETLKRLRLSKNMTQKFVARENGLSSGMISLIESNSISASITTLSKLLKFFGVRMSWLFDDNNENQKYEVIRKDGRKTLSKIFTQNAHCNGNGFFCESLSQIRQKKMQPYIVTLSDEIVSDNFFVHYGESFMYVLKGTFDLTLGGCQVVLKEGDSVYLDASLEHRFRSKDGSEVSVLVVKAAVS